MRPATSWQNSTEGYDREPGLTTALAAPRQKNETSASARTPPAATMISSHVLNLSTVGWWSGGRRCWRIVGRRYRLPIRQASVRLAFFVSFCNGEFLTIWLVNGGTLMFKPTRRQQAKLIKVLVEARKKAKLTQEQLSLRIHADETFVNKFERGNRELSFFEFHALVKAMERDPVEIAKEVWSEDD
jgi:hypothetical protein